MTWLGVCAIHPCIFQFCWMHHEDLVRIWHHDAHRGWSYPLLGRGSNQEGCGRASQRSFHCQKTCWVGRSGWKIRRCFSVKTRASRSQREIWMNWRQLLPSNPVQRTSVVSALAPTTLRHPNNRWQHTSSVSLHQPARRGQCYNDAQVGNPS